MRPRVFPAENGRRHFTLNVLVGFNEAAGIPRGKLERSSPTMTHKYRFNEAAGIPRGKPVYATREWALLRLALQ